MRAICLALVVINILALSVQLFIGAPDSAGEVRRSAPVNGEHSLVMLSERPPARNASAPRQTGAGQSPASGRAPEQRQKGALCELVGRSEEHTSELQSRGHLVCRLLLEKKKKQKKTTTQQIQKNTQHTTTTPYNI